MSSPRILVLRTSALGDIVHALPVLSRLRRELPTATVGWVVEKAFAPLLRGHPDIDELLVAELRPWRHRLLRLSTWRQIARFVHEVQAFSAEIVLDLMGNHKAGVLAALTLADRRLGFARRDRREPSSAIWISEQIPARGVHAVDRMLSLLSGLGMQPARAQFEGSKLQADDLDFDLGDGPIIVIHPTTAWPNKSYPPGSWGSVAAALARDFDVSILVCPGPGEEAVAAEIVSAAGSSKVQAMPPPSLRSLVSLQRRAALVMGGDTGPVHLAHALGAPALCVMGPTDPARHGPYEAPGHAVFHRLPCSFCHLRLDGTRACLANLEPLEVIEKARAVVCDRFH